MPTNDEIVQEHRNHECNPKVVIDESQFYNQYCIEVMLDEARSDTAKPIVKELEKRGTLVHRESIEGTKKNNYVRFKSDSYQALKKKYKVD